MTNLDQQDQRIAKLFRKKEVPGVTNENLRIYLDFLRKNLNIPCEVTGREDMGCFAWEERYIHGSGDDAQYSKLKKDKASFTDNYKLLDIHDDYDEDDGLIASVQRISDRKRFNLTLSDLVAANQQLRHHQLLEDYSSWFENCR